MSEYVYYEQPVRKSSEIKKCKLCGGQPKIDVNNFGYCSVGVTIACNGCGIKRHDKGDFNNGGSEHFVLSFIGSWNRLMS